MTTYHNEIVVKLTEIAIKDVVEHYRDRINDGNMKKIIERGIAKRLVMFVPEEWSQIEIEVYEMAYDLNTIVQFTNDAGDTLTAIHNEIDVLDCATAGACVPNKEWWNVTWKAEHGMNGQMYAVPDIPDMEVHIVPPTSQLAGFGITKEEMIKDMIDKPMRIGVSSRGIADVDDCTKFATMSWITDTPVLLDDKGTCGWSEEVTVTAADCEESFFDMVNGELVAVDGFYDPHSLTEDFYFPNTNTARGSRVETLPGGQGLGELSDLEDFCDKVRKGMSYSVGCSSTVAALGDSEIEFTLDDLDELTELLNTVESQEMKF